MTISRFESLFLKSPRGLFSRFRIFFYCQLGLKSGQHNRMEAMRCRRLSQIKIGDYNAFTAGCWLWPEDSHCETFRICIGNHNYFNRNVMIDACNYIEIGNENMFGPDIYITDSNHRFGLGTAPHTQPMDKGKVKIGNCCWIGAKAVILKDVELGDYCIVGAGAIVTRSFPAGSVVVGIPAKVTKTLESSGSTQR